MRSRWLFFHLFTYLSIPGRFTPIFLTAHSLTPSQLGFLIALPNLISLVSTPLLCNLADRTRPESITFISHLCALFFFLLQSLAFPPFHILPPSARFPTLLACSIAFGLFGPASYALVSAIALSQLRTLYGDRAHQFFGRERLWGALSWAISSLILGVILDLPFINMSVIYLANFLAGIIFAASVFAFASHHDKPTPQSAHSLVELQSIVESQTSHHSPSSASTSNSLLSQSSMSPLTALSQIFAKSPLCTFMFFNLFFWLNAGMSLVENLLFLFMQQDLHASNLVCGLSVVITVIFEVPLFAVTPMLLRRLGSTGLVVLGCVAYIVRVWAYTLVPNAWMLLIFEPLHGVTFAAVSTASVAFVAERVPHRLEATGQSVLTFIEALAFAFGTAAGGYVIQLFGSNILYKGAAMCVMLATLAFVAVHMIWGRAENGREEVQDATNFVSGRNGNESGHR